MVKRKLADVRAKIKSLVHLEEDVREAMRNCDRELPEWHRPPAPDKRLDCPLAVQ